MKKHISIISLALLLTMISCTTIKINPGSKPQGVAKNIIFMIVDGMGFEHVKAARIFNGEIPFSFERYPCTSRVSTCPFAGADVSYRCTRDREQITDSAAAATAMATGIKVKNGVISRRLPGSSDDMETILELMKRMKKSTGIVATKLVSDATPAAFVSHADDRSHTEDILKSMFNGATPNVILGADDELHRRYAESGAASYQMVHSAQALRNLANEISRSGDCTSKNCPHIYGGFSAHEMIPGVYGMVSGLPLEASPERIFKERDLPHLSEMTDAALKILSKNSQGFFLMVESSMPDMISHYNRIIDGIEGADSAIYILIREMLQVQKTIHVIESFVNKNPDTLVILTADHETGGLMVDDKNTSCVGQKGCVPKVYWTSLPYESDEDGAVRHTGVDVPLYAVGRGAERFCKANINNTDIPHLALGRSMDNELMSQR